MLEILGCYNGLKMVSALPWMKMMSTIFFAYFLSFGKVLTFMVKIIIEHIGVVWNMDP